MNVLAGSAERKRVGVELYRYDPPLHAMHYSKMGKLHRDTRPGLTAKLCANTPPSRHVPHALKTQANLTLSSRLRSTQLRRGCGCSGRSEPGKRSK
jgi:hypothetical protein